ncbi:MAG: type II CRISPR RNA-guided endonuclease Cas9 [Bacteroidales bacterium]|nr:type II CRISPR RNA-guided endonuclease Cas9 [Lentimicrobiaceae bacterium]MDD5694301.1 type II CRISPR RNA-guided endonuclease Cas9 [Bacteroidales bacterium]
MKKILGLDLGITSIGWAFITETEKSESDSSKILGLGCRIIPLSAGENDEFTKGNAQSTNATRRMKRSIRRNLQRYGLRKTMLSKELIKHGIYPNEGLFKLDALSLYGLRYRAVSEQISLEEIGRLLYMLNQKRGYNSNRKANSEEENSQTRSALIDKDNEADHEPLPKQKKKDYLDLIADREAIIRHENLTIGQFFYRELQKDPHFRVKENIFTRKSYIDEFNKIWDTQSQYYPDILSKKLKKCLRDEIIYYQRSLRSQKALVSECRFEKQHKVAPKSSPLFQVCKIWQEINNLEIISFKGIKGVETDPRFNKHGKRDLSIDEKQKLFSALFLRDKITKKELLSFLGYKSGYDEYSINLQKDIEGNRTAAMLKKTFDKLNMEREDLFHFDLLSIVTNEEFIDQRTGEITTKQIITAEFEKQPLYQLWHLIYSVDETDKLIASLCKKFGFTPDQAAAISKIDFQRQGYGSLSARAIRKVLPYLMQGYKYADATLIAGYRHSDYLTQEENDRRILRDRLTNLTKGSLRNPVVEKILNQTINLVNDILQEPNLGRPDEIRIELARELRQNADERKRTFQNISRLDERHKEIADRLREELSLRRVSRSDIERYKLWEEFGKISPYEPNKTVSLTELFSGGYDIEHIIPKSRMFDDSFSNKTICSRRLNTGLHGKNQMTAFDFMKSRGENEFSDYMEFVTGCYKQKKISKSKFDKLMMSVDQIPEDFINRQLQDTRYISREIKSLLSQVCRNVYSTSGAVTDYQRYIWGYDLITQQLNFNRYQKEGRTSIETDKNGNKIYIIEGWTKRDDHRHHAVDAIVIANTKQSTIQRLNNLNQIVMAKEGQSQADALKESDLLGVEEFVKSVQPFPKNEIENAVSNILVSFKSGKRVAISNRNTYKFKTGEKTVQIVLTPRGYLHKETIYGRIRRYEEVRLTSRFNRMDDLAFRETRTYLTDYLNQVNIDVKLAFSSKDINGLKDSLSRVPVKGIRIKDGSVYVSCFKNEHVVRYPLSTIKEKDVEFIVDKTVREIIRKRIEEYGEKNAFKDLANNPLWLNKERGLVIKSVRIFTNLEDLVPLHRTIQGKTLPFSSQIDHTREVDYVSTRNNHHIALYRDKNGTLQENLVTFWDAFMRKLSGIPVVIKKPESIWDYIIENSIEEQTVLSNLPLPDWEFVTSMQQNEMFVFGLSADEIVQSVENNNYELISQHLYRVQKIASKYYVFRHHLETSVDDKKSGGDAVAIRLGKMIRITSLEKMTGIKVRISRLGMIEKIGE